MHKGFVTMTFCVLMLSGFWTMYSQAAEIDLVSRHIAGRAKKLKAEEYPDARMILSADVNGDGKKDLVVLYTLEGFGGGNDYKQYISVFLAQKDGLHYTGTKFAGGRFFRNLTLKSVSKGRIYFDTEEWKETNNGQGSDAACCPSKKGTASFALRNKKLVEITDSRH